MDKKEQFSSRDLQSTSDQDIQPTSCNRSHDNQQPIQQAHNLVGATHYIHQQPIHQYQQALNFDQTSQNMHPAYSGQLQEGSSLQPTSLHGEHLSQSRSLENDGYYSDEGFVNQSYHHPMVAMSSHQAATPLYVNTWPLFQRQFECFPQQVSLLPSTSHYQQGYPLHHYSALGNFATSPSLFENTLHNVGNPNIMSLLEDDGLRIQNLLLDAAKQKCKSSGFQVLTQQQIEICPLEITDKPSRKVYRAGQKPPKKRIKAVHAPQYTDEDGHYNRNEDYEKIDLKQDSKVLVEQLFPKAEERANDQGQPQFANIVALIGQPGIGKTTLSKVITEMAISGQMETVDKIQFCFYISLKEIDFTIPTTLVSFLLKYSLTTDSYSKSPVKQNNEKFFLQKLLKSEHVLITMDGLDEAATDWDLAYTHVDPLIENNPLQYIYALMRGDLLRNAKKIFTSRQKQFFSIGADNRPLFVAEVMGLNEKSQEMLCNQICKDNGAQVWNVIKSNPNFMYSCYVPAKCIFIAFVIWKSLKEGGDGRFHSLTHVFANGFKYYFKQDFVRGETTNLDQREYLNKIAKLAWNGFENRKMVFSKDDLRRAGIEPQTLSGILLTFVTEENWNLKFIDCEIMSNFSHLIWQEYFAACYLIFFLPFDEFSKLLPRLKTPRWQVVAKFVFGLCNEEVVEVAKDCFSDIAIKETNLKKQSLKEICEITMQKAGDGKRTLLQVSSWLQEIYDEELFANIIKLLPETICLNGPILPTDAYSISYLMCKSEQAHNIRVLASCRFVHGSFTTLLADKRTQIKDVTVSHNARSRMLKELAKHPMAMRRLIIESNCPDMLEPQPTHIFFKRFVHNFQPRNQLTSMVLNGFDFNDESATAVQSCVNMTKGLSLTDCKLSSSVVINIASAISTLNQQMEHLDLSGTVVFKSFVLLLCDQSVLNVLDKLYLPKFKISENGTEYNGKVDLISCLSESPMQSKKLENFVKSAFEIASFPNQLVASGDFQACSLSFITHLFPQSLQLTLVEVSNFAIQEVLSEIDHEFASLVLDKISVNTAVASSIASTVQMLQNLALRGCSISGSDMGKIAISISLLSKQLTLLELDHTDIDDEGASAIASCVHMLKNLSLSGCNIPCKGIYTIASSLSRLERNIQSLDISGNLVSLSATQLLLNSTIVNHCQNMYLDKFRISENGIERIGKLDVIPYFAQHDVKSMERMESFIPCIFQICSIPNNVCVNGDWQSCALSFIMHLFPSTLELKMKNVSNFALQEVMKSVETKVALLKLDHNTLDDNSASAVAAVVQWIDWLSLQDCKMTSDRISVLAEPISHLQTPLKKLNLSNNWIGDSGAASVAGCIHNIEEEVDLSKCHIQYGGVEILCEKIKDLQKPLKKVNLSRNKIGDSGAASVAGCIHKIEEEVDLSKCHIQDGGVEILCEKIKDLQTPLKKVNLSRNKIGDSGAASVAGCIHKIEEEVDLSKCHIQDGGVEILCEKIKDLQTPLKKVNLSRNKIGDSGAASVAGCIHKIEEEVDLSKCHIQDGGVKILCEKIKDLQKPLKKLNLSRNWIGDSGAASVAGCIHNIEKEVDLRGCDIEDGGLKILCEKIKHLQKPMKFLDLSENNLTDKSAESFASCVHNIEKLDAWGCHLTRAGEDLITSKSRGEVVFRQAFLMNPVL